VRSAENSYREKCDDEVQRGIVAGTNPPARKKRERERERERERNCEGRKEKERRVPCYERAADAMQVSDSHLASRGNA